MFKAREADVFGLLVGNVNLGTVAFPHPSPPSPKHENGLTSPIKLFLSFCQPDRYRS